MPRIIAARSNRTGAQTGQATVINGPIYETVNMKFAYHDSSKGKIIHGQEKVAKKMELDATAYSTERVGTKPKVGELEHVMNSLNRNFNEESFIRGHLLNEKLGGPGIAQNLFPITSQANSEHSHRVEKPIKDFMDEYYGKNISGSYGVEIRKHGDSSAIGDGVNTMSHDFDIVCSCNFKAMDDNNKEINKIKSQSDVIIQSKAVGRNMFYDMIKFDEVREEDTSKAHNTTRYTDDHIKDMDFLFNKMDSIDQASEKFNEMFKKSLNNSYSYNIIHLSTKNVEDAKKSFEDLSTIKNELFSKINSSISSSTTGAGRDAKYVEKFEVDKSISKNVVKKRKLT